MRIATPGNREKISEVGEVDTDTGPPRQRHRQESHDDGCGDADDVHRRRIQTRDQKHEQRGNEHDRHRIDETRTFESILKRYAAGHERCVERVVVRASSRSIEHQEGKILGIVDERKTPARTFRTKDSCRSLTESAPATRSTKGATIVIFIAIRKTTIVQARSKEATACACGALDDRRPC